MRLEDICRAETHARKPYAGRLDDLADAVGGRAEAVRSHQFQRHIVEREHHAIGTVAAVLPGRRAAQERLIGDPALVDVLEQNNDMIETSDHASFLRNRSRRRLLWRRDGTTMPGTRSHHKRLWGQSLRIISAN